MFEGKKILILDLIVFSVSYIFVFWLSKLNPILNSVVWFGGWSIVTMIHEFGHSFVCAVSGGFPLIIPSSLGGGFTFATLCSYFTAQSVFVGPIRTVFGIIFECIFIFLLFYLASATNEKTFSGLTYSFVSSTLAWINVGLLQKEITTTITGSDVSKLISLPGVTTDIVVTSITSLTILLSIIALRYGLEEEQKSSKINIINLEILPPDITYTNFFLLSFFVLCSFLGISVLIQFFQPNLSGIIITVLLFCFAFYLHTIYRIGGKFKKIVMNIKINLKEVKTSYSFLSAIFQCVSEKNVTFSIVYKKQGWTLNIPAKNISVNLPDYILAEDVASRIDKIFTYNKL